MDQEIQKKVQLKFRKEAIDDPDNRIPKFRDTDTEIVKAGKNIETEQKRPKSLKMVTKIIR